MSVVGARPNFMKIAPFIRAINNHNLNRSEAIRQTTDDGPWSSVLGPPSSVLRPRSSVLRHPSSVLGPRTLFLKIELLLPYLFCTSILPAAINIYFQVAGHFNIIDKPSDRSSHSRLVRDALQR